MRHRIDEEGESSEGSEGGDEDDNEGFVLGGAEGPGGVPLNGLDADDGTSSEGDDDEVRYGEGFLDDEAGEVSDDEDDEDE